MPPDLNAGLDGDLSGYFQKKKAKGPTAAPEVPTGLPSVEPAAPRFVGSVGGPSAPAGAGPGARAPGGKSPTGFVGFERYFSANEPAIRAEAKKVVSEAAGPAGTKTMSMGGRPTMSIGPSFAGGQYSATRMGQAPSTTIAKPTQMQRGEARAAKEAVGGLTEPGAYQAQAGRQTKAQADFNAMLLQGVLPEEAKAEQKRLSALEQRLGQQASAEALGALERGRRSMMFAQALPERIGQGPLEFEAPRPLTIEERRQLALQNEAIREAGGYYVAPRSF